MELAHALAASTLRDSLTHHQQEARNLRDLIATSPSSTVRMLAGIDLVNVCKTIDAETQRIREFESA